MPYCKHFLSIILLFSGLNVMLAQRVSFLSGEKADLFTIFFPEAPSFRIDTAYLGEAPILIEKYSSSIFGEQGTSSELFASVSEYPPEYIHSDSSFTLIDGFLNSTILSDVESGEVELLISSHQFAHGYPGKKFEAKILSNGWRYEKHCFLIDNFLVELETISEKWFWKTSSDFLNSFKISKDFFCKKDYGLNIVEAPSFRIAFPDSTQKTRSIIDSQAGPISTYMEIMERELKVGNIAFVAQEAGYPKSVFQGSFSLEEFYDNTINGSLASTNSKLIDKIKTSLAGHPGYQFSSSMFDGNATGIYRMALVKGRLYFIGVITLTDGINPEIEAFFNSFRLKG